MTIPVFTAVTADKYLLYQNSVQTPTNDIAFFEQLCQDRGQAAPLHLREDFCGTAYLCSEWLKSNPERSAEGFDIDSKVIEWGLEHNFRKKSISEEQLVLHCADVRNLSNNSPDIRCAQNFSYCVFKTRNELIQYFTHAASDLATGALFVLDLYGGPHAMEWMEEETEYDEFAYVWDQDEFWPVSAETRCYIHFRFSDGSKLEKAFEYDWRLWTLPEVRDCLEESGFSRVEVYWEGTAEDGESGDGNYSLTQRGENDDAWVSYIVASRD